MKPFCMSTTTSAVFAGSRSSKMCSRPRRAITRSMTDCEMDTLCMASPPGRMPDYAAGRAAGQRRRGVYSHRELSKIKQMHPTFGQIAARQAAWKPSKKVVSGRCQNAKKRPGEAWISHEIRRVFRRRPEPLAGRAALPGVCRSRAHRRPLSARHLARAAGPARGRDLVLQRLSRHGPAPQGDRRHGRDRDAHGHRRRRHPQHRRHQPSAGRA